MSTEYRIDFTIERRGPLGEWEDFGFGGSGQWRTIDEALYEVSSSIQNGEWTSAPGVSVGKDQQQ